MPLFLDDYHDGDGHNHWPYHIIIIEVPSYVSAIQHLINNVHICMHA